MQPCHTNATLHAASSVWLTRAAPVHGPASCLSACAVLDASPTGINVVQARGGRGAGGGDAG